MGKPVFIVWNNIGRDSHIVGIPIPTDLFPFQEFPNIWKNNKSRKKTSQLSNKKNTQKISTLIKFPNIQRINIMIQKETYRFKFIFGIFDSY